MTSFIYLYIDESGDLGEHGSKYFTIAAISIKEPKILERIIKKLRRRKLKKGIKQLPEIKANNSNAKIREYVLNKVKISDCEILAVIIEKNNVSGHSFKVKDELYNYLCGILMEKIVLPKVKLIITIDKKNTNTLIREDFDKYIRKKLESRNKDIKIDIYHKPSHTSNELQVVDF